MIDVRNPGSTTPSSWAAARAAGSARRTCAPGAAAGIRANAICPGMAYTPMMSWRLDQPELRAEVESRIPVGRVASAEEIADAVALLASGRLAYMTGHPLVIDGGMTAW